MAIVVKHDAPAPVGLATGLGQSISAAKQGSQDEENARFLLGLRERRREFDVNAALRVRAEDIDQRRYNTNLAMQDSRQQLLNENSHLNRQAQLEAQAMREESDIFQQQQAQQFEFAAQSAKTLDEQVFETEKAAQQLKLNPEGQRIRNEKIGGLRAIREKTAFARPDVRAAIYSQWLADYQQSNLSAYEEQTPTAQQKVFDNLVPLQGQQIVPGQPLPPGTYRSLKGTRNGVDSWETITIPKEDAATTAERVQRDSAPAPDGGLILWNPEKQTYTHIPPAKPEKEAAAKPVDTSKYVKEAISQLRADHQASQPNGPFSARPEAIKAKALELMALEKELEAEMAGVDIKDDASVTPPSRPTYDPMDAMIPDWDGMTGRPPDPVKVASMEEASRVQEGGTFIYNGQTYLVTGPGEAEPL